MNYHNCGINTCAFCKALDRPRQRKRGEGLTPRDEQAVKRSWEVRNSSQIESTKHALSSSNLEEMETYILLDRVTGLYNSRSFERELNHEVQRAQRTKNPMSLCMIAVEGLDNYVQFNGSIAGDGMLKLIASGINKSIREIDSAGRYGSDTFAVILPETNNEGANVVAERIRRTISSSILTNYGPNHNLTTSVAIATYPIHARKADELVDQALKALSYAAIQGGACITHAAAVI